MGEVISIAEDVSTPSPISMRALDSSKMAGVPIQQGTQNVGVSVTVVFSMR